MSSLQSEHNRIVELVLLDTNGEEISEDGLSQTLLAVEQEEILHANSHVVPVLSKLSDLTASLEPHTRKLRERRRIADKLYDRVSKCKERLATASTAYERAITKMNKRTNMRHVILREMESIEREIGPWKTLLSEKEAEYGSIENITQDNLKEKARALSAVHTMVSSPIKIEGITQPKYYWTTASIFIRDIDNTVLSHSFGKFDISIWNDHGELYCCFDPVDCDWNQRGGYPHPHVQESGNPCLGTASNLLMRCLLQRDITGLIRIVNSFLTNYNPNNPYIILSEWISNKYDMGVCELCDGAHEGICTDHWCSSCGATYATQESLSGCGSCPSCCQDRHNWCTESARLNTGINSTGCQSKSLFYRGGRLTANCPQGKSLIYCSKRAGQLICNNCAIRNREESTT